MKRFFPVLFLLIPFFLLAQSHEVKDVKHSDGRLMKAVFLSDIEELEKAGIHNPAWADVKDLLK